MFDFAKMLVEEPAKRRQFIFFVLKFILSAIVTSKFYSLIYGEYELINFTIPEFWNELYNFILSGNSVVVFFIYLVCHFLLFDVFASIPSLILNSISKGLFSNKADLKDNDFIRFLLKKLSVITFDNKTKKPGIGENFEEFYSLLNLYQNQETKQEVRSFRNSFMNETLHVYFVFVLIYFCFLELEKSGLFTIVLIIGLVINIFSYLILYFFIQFFNSNGKEIIFGLHLLSIENSIVEFLNDNRILFTENEKPLRNKLSKFIVFNDTEFVIDIYLDRIPITKSILERYVQQAIKKNIKRIVLVSDKKSSIQAKKNMKNNKIKIDFIYFKNHLALNKKLEKIFFE